ncbi:MAG: PEP-CTERM sorting domain-containing protein [Phycisphaeraceae bacterium]|nr:PEP-CTERM sorting domain-containing protein [Phycisphaeraceae bacterium]
MRTYHALLPGLAIVLAATGSVRGDPLQGEILKFQQLPMIATPIPGPTGEPVLYFGHDESSTAYGNHQVGQYQGWFMADDFADYFNTPVVHVRWWGSYLGGQNGLEGVQKFLIAFETDVPDPGDPHDPADGFSHPGVPLLTQIVDRGALFPGSGTFTEALVPGSNPAESVFMYNAELACPFPQQPETVYWLKIVALVDPERDGMINWGWHNRDYTIPDPLAAGPPVPFPGEHDDRPIIDPLYPTEVWHFQDDAVMGDMVAQVLGPCDVNLYQTAMTPQNYVNELDGPGPNGVHGGIGQFSKDLAFELYTIPEPGTWILLAIGGAAMFRRRSSKN